MILFNLWQYFLYFFILMLCFIIFKLTELVLWAFLFCGIACFIITSLCPVFFCWIGTINKTRLSRIILFPPCYHPIFFNHGFLSNLFVITSYRPGWIIYTLNIASLWVLIATTISFFLRLQDLTILKIFFNSIRYHSSAIIELWWWFIIIIFSSCWSFNKISRPALSVCSRIICKVLHYKLVIWGLRLINILLLLLKIL